MDSPHRLSLARIEAAARTIDPVFLHSPQLDCEPLAMTLKIETINPIRSFKGRGADFFVAESVRAGDRGPWACASAGNFGQAMAYACRKHQIALTVFVTHTANPFKVARMRALGATVISAADDFGIAKREARTWCSERGVTFVEDGDDPRIAEGAGTIAVELCARGAFATVVIPVGDGALVTGMGRWIRAHAPATRVIGVCSRGATAVHDSWRRGEVVSAPAMTIADGIAVSTPVAAAVADLRGLVDDIVLVDDAQLIAAMRALHAHAGIVVEPAGAAGVAAALAIGGPRIATVVTGGNVTHAQLAEWRIADHSGS
ncbi:MAG: pyridoxal-phosphate dependent enzyme [Kofleriaceae bacterium]